MIIVKIMILLVLLTLFYWLFWFLWLKRNQHEIILSNYISTYVPKGGYAAVILVWLSLISIIASIVWALFVWLS